jgi:hypothetical protein
VRFLEVDLRRALCYSPPSFPREAVFSLVTTPSGGAPTALKEYGKREGRRRAAVAAVLKGGQHQVEAREARGTEASRKPPSQTELFQTYMGISSISKEEAWSSGVQGPSQGEEWEWGEGEVCAKPGASLFPALAADAAGAVGGGGGRGGSSKRSGGGSTQRASFRNIAGQMAVTAAATEFPGLG